MMMTEAMEGTSAETEGRRKFLAVSLVSSFKFDCLSCRLCLFFYLQCPDSDDWMQVVNFGNTSVFSERSRKPYNGQYFRPGSWLLRRLTWFHSFGDWAQLPNIAAAWIENFILVLFPRDTGHPLDKSTGKIVLAKCRCFLEGNDVTSY